MARLIEFLFFLLIIYLAYRRIAGPFRRGFDARDRERADHQRMNRDQSQRFDHSRNGREPITPKIDRTQVEDAEFEDLDDRK